MNIPTPFPVRRALLCLGLLAAASVALAEMPQPPAGSDGRVRGLLPGGSGLEKETGGPLPVRHDYFSGAAVRLPLLAELPPGKHTLTADLFQEARSLLAPLQKELPVASLELKGKPAPGSPLVSAVVEWSLRLPEVKRETRLRAVIRLQPAPGSREPATSRVVGQVNFTLYPRDFAKDDLAKFARERELRLSNLPALARFLKEQEVDFAEAPGGGRPFEELLEKPGNDPRPAVHFLAADFKEWQEWQARHRDWPGIAVVFSPDAPLATVCITALPRGERQAFAVLPASHFESPRDQKALVEILKTLTGPDPQ